MYWEKIEGFFNFWEFYDLLASKFRDGTVFVEIGAWKGQSTMYMAEKIKSLGLNMSFITIDAFTGFPEFQYDKSIIEGTLFDEYSKNIEPLRSYIITRISDSKEAAAIFENESVDHIFMDGSHIHKIFEQDIEAWYPKIKTGGIFSGHDYVWEGYGIKPIIDKFLKGKVEVFTSDVWYYVKKSKYV